MRICGRAQPKNIDTKHTTGSSENETQSDRCAERFKI